MQRNYSSASETFGISEDLLVWWWLAAGSMAVEISKLCAHCIPSIISCVGDTLEIRDTASV